MLEHEEDLKPTGFGQPERSVKALGIKGNWEVGEQPRCMLSITKFCVRPTCLGKGENRIITELVPGRHLQKIGPYHVGRSLVLAVFDK